MNTSGSINRTNQHLEKVKTTEKQTVIFTTLSICQIFCLKYGIV